MDRTRLLTLLTSVILKSGPLFLFFFTQTNNVRRRETLGITGMKKNMLYVFLSCIFVFQPRGVLVITVVQAAAAWKILEMNVVAYVAIQSMSCWYSCIFSKPCSSIAYSQINKVRWSESSYMRSPNSTGYCLLSHISCLLRVFTIE